MQITISTINKGLIVYINDTFTDLKCKVRMRVRTAAFEERTIDSQLIIWEDVENVIVKDFK
jgi:hypothetical protein